jgi:hypothetical protein
MRISTLNGRTLFGRRRRRTRNPRQEPPTLNERPAPEPRVWSLLLPPGYSRRP